MSNNNEHNNCAETFKIMNGRRYINEEDVSYYLPNDDKETDRISLEHNMLRYIWQGNFSSKIEERLIKGNSKVIDLGCGPGEWTIDLSLKYSSSTFIGIDIASVSFPSEDDRPENVAFLQHNLLENPGVPFPDMTFDFAFLRTLAFSLDESIKRGWFHVISEVVRVVNLNGYIEIMNYDLYKDLREEMKAGPIFSRLHRSLLDLHDRDKVKMPTGAEAIGFLQRTNKITNIRIEERMFPMGSWGGKLGDVALACITMALRGFKAHLQPFMKITSDEYDNLLNEIRNECAKYQTRYFSYRVYGIKC